MRHDAWQGMSGGSENVDHVLCMHMHVCLPKCYSQEPCIICENSLICKLTTQLVVYITWGKEQFSDFGFVLNFSCSCVNFNFLTMVLILLTCYIKVLFILKTECWCLKIFMPKASISIAWPYPRLCVSQWCWKPKDAQGLTQSLRKCTPFGKCFPD